MSYCFRLKVRMLTTISPHDEPFFLETASFPPIKVSNLGKAGRGSWIVFKSCNFSDKQEAIICGQRFKDSLLASGAIHRLGIDIGFDRETLRFSNAVATAMKNNTGKQIRGDTHGLMTFEEEVTQIVAMSATISVGITPEVFRNKLSPWCARGFILNEKQRVCTELLNDSFFVTDKSAQFVLRISAVESLCDQSDSDYEHQRVLDHLLVCLGELKGDGDTKESVRRKLLDAKRSSIRQAYMRKFRSLTSADDAKKFDRLYNLRSKLVHEGKGRGELLSASNEALDLVTKLLEADIWSGLPEVSRDNLRTK